MDSNLSKAFAIAKMPTPLLNSPHFQAVFGGQDGSSLPLDNQGLIREVEAVAFTGTKLQILDRLNDFIVKVKTEEYPSEELYADSRFLENTEPSISERKKSLPSPQQVLSYMYSLLGSTYIWGGNWSLGIPQLLAFYPPSREIDIYTQTLWSLKGVDCSGLLYEATNGYTPRNTSQLVSYGTPLPISGKSTKEIAGLLQPLDLIVWRGHVVMVFDQKYTIESRLKKGVVLTPVEERLEEILKERKPGIDFVINRFI